MIFEMIGKIFGVMFNILKYVFDGFTNSLKNISDKLQFIKQRIHEDERHLKKYRSLKDKLIKQKKICDEL